MNKTQDNLKLFSGNTKCGLCTNKPNANVVLGKCGHSFCSTCYSRIAPKMGCVICPTCHTTNEVDSKSVIIVDLENRCPLTSQNVKDSLSDPNRCRHHPKGSRCFHCNGHFCAHCYQCHLVSLKFDLFASCLAVGHKFDSLEKCPELRQNFEDKLSTSMIAFQERITNEFSAIRETLLSLVDVEKEAVQQSVHQDSISTIVHVNNLVAKANYFRNWFVAATSGLFTQQVDGNSEEFCQSIAKYRDEVNQFQFFKEDLPSSFPFPSTSAPGTKELVASLVRKICAHYDIGLQVMPETQNPTQMEMEQPPSPNNFINIDIDNVRKLNLPPAFCDEQPRSLEVGALMGDEIILDQSAGKIDDDFDHDFMREILESPIALQENASQSQSTPTPIAPIESGDFVIPRADDLVKNSPGCLNMNLTDGGTQTVTAAKPDGKPSPEELEKPSEEVVKEPLVKEEMSSDESGSSNGTTGSETSKHSCSTCSRSSSASSLGGLSLSQGSVHSDLAMSDSSKGSGKESGECSPPLSDGERFMEVDPDDSRLENIANRLHEAARRGDMQSLRDIFASSQLSPSDRSKVVDHQDKNDCLSTLLHQACQRGDLAMVRYLVEQQLACLESVDQAFCCPIYIAVAQGRLDVTLYLLAHMEKVMPNEVSNYVEDALSLAIASSSRHIVDRLLTDHSYLVAFKDEEDNNLLHMAVCRDRAGILQLLMAKGVDPKQPNVNGDTPLHVACQQNKKATVSVLVDNCPDLLNVKNHLGQTPYDVAASKNHTELVNIFLARCSGTIPAVTE